MLAVTLPCVSYSACAAMKRLSVSSQDWVSVGSPRTGGVVQAVALS